MPGKPKYNPQTHPEMARDFCASQGGPEKDLAKHLNVSVDTITAWKKTHPEFRAALKEGKAQRPATYNPEYHPAKAYEFCSEFGFTDLKLAHLFDVKTATITNWKKEHPEFFASLKAGKDEFDSCDAEKSLLKRVRGFRYVETTREVSNAPDQKNGKGKLVITKKVTKQVPPDPTSLIFFLKNRQPARWRDKREVEVDGNVTIEVVNFGDGKGVTPSANTDQDSS